MTKREIETLKKGYQIKCTIVKVRRKANPNSEAYAEAESERVGYLHAAIELLEFGKRQGSARPLIDEWEKEVGFDSRA
nr:MAG TPA: hypothetical protein [Caudoviricetes sp.]